ncbi:MAG: DUF5063 domain-containing protein [Bacteroidales bacterium]|jgi:hypothetical protein|nr:DUF5063 domain-containing protein [Bacteroidales bacterium]
MTKIDVLLAPENKEFVQLCSKYCDYLERLPDANILQFWETQLQSLSAIYQGVLNLPSIEARYSFEVDKFVTEKAYNKVLKGLSKLIGELDSFPDLSDLSYPGSAKLQPVNLSELLTDVYQELKDFVLLYETATLENMNDALCECADTFGQYWGVKLLTSLRIIHVNLYQQRYAANRREQDLEIDIEEVIGDYTGDEEA